MARIYSLAFGVLTGLLAMGWQPDLLFVTAQAQTMQDRKAEADLLRSQGIQQHKTSQFEAALRSWQKALTIYREINDRKGEGRTLNNLGIVYHSFGKYDKAIDYHLQALAIAREIKDKEGEGKDLGNLGIVYLSLGKYDKYIEYEQQWLAISREIKDRESEAAALNNLGIAYERLGKYDKAIECYLQDLALSREIKDRLGESNTLVNLGTIYKILDKTDKAIEYFVQALAIKRDIKDRWGEVQALSNLGAAYLALIDFDKAIDYERQALAISREINNRESESNALSLIGYMLYNRTDLAILYYKQSINVRESIRKDIRKLDKDLQQSYLKTVSIDYKRLADRLLDRGRVIEALQVLDLLKIQELDDYLKNIKGNDRTSQGIRLLEPEKVFSIQLPAFSFQQSRELNRQLARQIQRLPKSEIDKPPDYLQKLPQGTALLYPLILDDRLEIVLFSANTPAIHRTVNIKKDDLEKLVTEFKDNLVQGRKDPSDDGFLKPAQKLYDILIKPIEADLKNAKTTTILYAPDGKLRYVPLTALYDGKQFLIENYAVNNLIAYILTDFTPKTSKQPSVLAGAFGGKKGEKLFGQDALPASLVEVSEIGKLIENSKALIENNFGRKATEGQLPNYNILHLSTHAEFKSGDPDNSFILFGNGDILRLREISELKMPNIELIVLSACETAVVKSGSGVEILGFGYQIQKAGAKSAIASLWRVNDAGTQSLMQAFYGYVKQGDRSKASALRQAQIDLIRGKQFSHPFYWSPFILIGNGL
ncbi:CHAT domain-containing protein [Tumidithrix elongata RA019]|uniref:CHAT domain-containing protein n=1 Tax=Tumidithrix elongata BACA0141 TaxID=2716417 RepID=A0AAW9PU69_9CYAN|nr:CHAT domain-containing protein [Tumidithrix elongata RA019]